MAKPRELKRRIRSVQNTRKITKTMELVSTSKLKRAQDRVVGARPYAQALAEVIGELYSPELAERFPLLRQPGRSVRGAGVRRSEEHTSELQSHSDLVCRLLLEKKKKNIHKEH